MNIVVRSRSEAKAFTSDVPWAAISVSSHPDEFPKLNLCQRVGLLQMCFHDVDDVSHWEQSPDYDPELEPRPFRYQMAQEIWRFVEQHRGQIQTLLVHCHAGVSRSPAIAGAIAKCLYGDDQPYFRGKCPNMRVYRKLMVCWENNQAARALKCLCDWHETQGLDSRTIRIRAREDEACPVHVGPRTVTDDDGVPE